MKSMMMKVDNLTLKMRNLRIILKAGTTSRLRVSSSKIEEIAISMWLNSIMKMNKCQYWRRKSFSKVKRESFKA
jgi:hypothetical protein